MAQALCTVMSSREFGDHVTPDSHLESAARIQVLLEALGGRSLLEPRLASDDELLRCHTRLHIERVEQMAKNPGWVDTGTFACQVTPRIARLAAGGCLRLAEAIYNGEARRGLALVRPPGHHAEAELIEGFCFYSNVALTAHHLHALGLHRIAVLDWDVHHGNGTASLLSGCSWARFIDLHQEGIYPGSGSSEERGDGSLFHLPLPAGLGNADYLHLVESVIGPLLEEFEPEFLLVSCGFDPDARDPLGGMKLDPEGFFSLTDAVVCLAEKGSCQGRLMLVLEGGYDLLAVKEGVSAVLARLDDPATCRRSPLSARPDELAAVIADRARGLYRVER